MPFKNIIVKKEDGGGGGGGGDNGGSGGFVDNFTLGIEVTDTSAQQDDAVSFEIDANYDDIVDVQVDKVSFGFEGFQEFNAEQSEERQSAVERYATAFRGEANNPQRGLGPEDDLAAVVKAGGILGGFQQLELVIEPPFDDTENNPVAQARYIFRRGILDRATAGLFYYVNTTAGEDSPVTPYDLTFNAGTTNQDTAFTYSGVIEEGDLFLGVAGSASQSGATLGTPSSNNGVNVAGTLTVGTNRGATLSETALVTGDRNKSVDNFAGLGQNGAAGVTANMSAGVFIRGWDTGNFEESSPSMVSITSPLFTATLPSVTTTQPNSLIVYLVSCGGFNPANGNPSDVNFDDEEVGVRVKAPVSGGSQFLSTGLIGTVVQEAVGQVPNRTITIERANGRAVYMRTYALAPAEATGEPSLVLQDLPVPEVASRVFVPLQNIDTNSEVFFRFTHGALLPVLGGSIDIDNVQINSTEVL